MNMIIEILGDVWLLSEVIAISLDEPSEGEYNQPYDIDSWQVSLRIRGIDEWVIYEMGSEDEARQKHIELVTAWKKFLTA